MTAQSLPSVPKTAMIMAAGLGKRMMPLTAEIPKPLVRVGGVCLIDHVLMHLRDAEIARIIVNVHYRGEQMEQHLAEHAQDFDVTISDERDLLRDTGGGLVKALPSISSDPFLCVNADNMWTNGPRGNALHTLSQQWDETKMDVLMLVVPLERAINSQGRGDFDLDGEGRLSRRIQGQSASHVWTGIQILSKRLIVDPPSDVFSTNIFWDRAIADGRCFGCEHDGDWFDVGYPAAVAATEAAMADG